MTTARARWTGPHPDGRLDYIDRETLARELPVLHERVRLSRPGEIRPWDGLWRRFAGTLPGEEDVATLRAVRWTDPAGLTRGLVVYRLTEDPTDYSRHTLEVQHLLADGADASAALWRFLLEHDLVATVTARLQPVDDPVRWMIADQRGAVETRGEHQWLRVLDVPAILRARTYSAPGRFTLRVHDDLGLADGAWMLEVADDGIATVSTATGAADVDLGVDALASILLGGVRPSTLRAAGRLDADAQVTASLERAFASPRTPYLSVWY
jgi:predicted acetyltransferase